MFGNGDFDGGGRTRRHSPTPTGSMIEGSSFSGLLTRVEIGHIRMAREPLLNNSENRTKI
jgi:hypothetical protein